MQERLLLRPEEAAQRLGVSRSVIYELIAEGRLDSIRIGRSRRVLASACEAFVTQERERQAVTV